MQYTSYFKPGSKKGHCTYTLRSTKSMLVVGKRLQKRLGSTEANLNLSLNGAINQQVKSHKLLGIYIDQDLDFDAQSDALCKSLSKETLLII